MAVLGGAGAMGRATVFDLTRNGYRVLLLDADLAAAQRIARRYGAGKAVADVADARDAKALGARIAGLGAVINAGPYVFNLTVMEAALRARCHYLDLGRPLPHDAEAAAPRRGLPQGRPSGGPRDGERARHHERHGPGGAPIP